MTTLDAATASRHAGPCGICRFGILSGQRYARLRSGALAHLVCIGRADWQPAITGGVCR